jgi:8-oxo-dGTP pyrophosphatase MutT (NUDIX family)
VPHDAAAGRRSARAVLIDGSGRLLLIKRTKPGHAPYWTAPGGGVEDSDASVVDALHRELAEELGATVHSATQVLMLDTPSTVGVDVQHFFVARLAALDDSLRTGSEYGDPSRGGYHLERVDLRGDALVGIDLRPDALKDFILANREALLLGAVA